MKDIKKKIIFIVILVVLFLIIFEIYNIVNKNEITNNDNENISENIQEDRVDSNEQRMESNMNSATIENNSNVNSNNNTDKTEITHVSPSGFMGSSLYRVVLYSNGEVYVVTFDGNGYEDENITSQDLIAKNVTSIKEAENEENYGEVIVEGGEKVNSDFGWIIFN